MTPHDIEQMKAKAEAGTVITQQEAHQALAEILRLREALKPFEEVAREHAADAPEWVDGNIIAPVTTIGALRGVIKALNGGAP